jgi:orotate phosphoribosyltransferase
MADIDKVLQIFHQSGAYLRGHFRLTSGLHSPEYLQCALVLQHPAFAEELGVQLATALKRLVLRDSVPIISAPALGGLIIGHEVARAMAARFVFAERDSAGNMMIRRGFSIQPGEAAIVVEDVVTTGKSTREVVDLLKAAGAEVLAAGSIIDRSGGQVEIGVPRVALATLQVVTYLPEECPLCKQGIPVIKPGSRPTNAPN